jgi:hypothetical protein
MYLLTLSSCEECESECQLIGVADLCSEYFILGCIASKIVPGEVMLCLQSVRGSVRGDIEFYRCNTTWNIPSAKKSRADCFAELGDPNASFNRDMKAFVEFQFQCGATRKNIFQLGLAQRSEYFKNLLLYECEKGNETIELAMDAEVFDAYYNYARTGEIIVNKEDVEAMVKLTMFADECCDQPLKCLCERHLVALVSEENAFDLLLTAWRISATRLFQACRVCVAINMLSKGAGDCLPSELVEQVISDAHNTRT